MATRSQIQYGAKGDSVKELQTALNNKGYNLETDGSFGPATRAAVRDYQSKNNLQVDGIVGEQTWASLFPSSTGSATTGKATASSGTSSSSSVGKTGSASLGDAIASVHTGSSRRTELPDFSYEGYRESDIVTQAKQMLDAQIAQKPGDYQSKYQDQIADLLDRILNREDFTYDLNGDALYQQYKNQYVNLGQQAMMDTMGQAAAMTGGYGNSYAQSAGQQSYQGYLQQLNDRVPELYQLALDKYRMEGDEMYDQYALMSDAEKTDYDRYRDTLGDWYTERDYLQNRYDTERDYDYGRYTDDRDFSYATHRDQISDTKWQEEFDQATRQYEESLAYQQYRDQVADEQWQMEFDEARRLAGASTGSSSTSSSRRSTGAGTPTPVEDDKPSDDTVRADPSKIQRYGNDEYTTQSTPRTDVMTDDVNAFLGSITTYRQLYDRGAETLGVNPKDYKSFNQYLRAILNQHKAAGMSSSEIATIVANLANKGINL